MTTVYTAEYAALLIARIAELEARTAELEAQVEALTPKPAVKSEWRAVYPDWSKWYGKRSTALDTQISNDNFIALVRKDVITHHDGKVEYKLTIEEEVK